MSIDCFNRIDCSVVPGINKNSALLDIISHRIKANYLDKTMAVITYFAS
jgi:hypothetical protein